ncbi:unnamed protein product [Staurois parvus]|uniref:Uncharacterized protein n=1 Tax=Staurois parvus TaxID=386267 RepID=A0ABN9AV81_9NEOB|nr:unnamed protein product [Staurois parvus]
MRTVICYLNRKWEDRCKHWVNVSMGGLTTHGAPGQ